MKFVVCWTCGWSRSVHTRRQAVNKKRNHDCWSPDIDTITEDYKDD